MKVRVSCPNGHQFLCDERWLGRKVICPKGGCGSTFRLTSNAQSPAAATMGVARCHGCGHPIDRSAIVCLNCGFNRVTRTHAKTNVILGRSAAPPFPTPGGTFAPHESARDPRAEEFRRLELQMNWVGGILTVFVFGGVAAIAFFLSSIDQPDWFWVRRLRWLFELVGWPAAWIILGSICALVSVGSFIELVRKGRVAHDIFEIPAE